LRRTRHARARFVNIRTRKVERPAALDGLPNKFEVVIATSFEISQDRCR
jgi:hypothetical protein